MKSNVLEENIIDKESKLNHTASDKIRTRKRHGCPVETGLFYFSEI
jgi:hypothetical protein